MSDVIVIFNGEPPQRVRLKGEWWSLSVIPTRPKSHKHWALFASCETDRREILVCSGNSLGGVRDAMATGFHVRAGTALRGLVTELRRAGVVTLSRPVQQVEGLEPPPFDWL